MEEEPFLGFMMLENVNISPSSGKRAIVQEEKMKPTLGERLQRDKILTKFKALDSASLLSFLAISSYSVKYIPRTFQHILHFAKVSSNQVFGHLPITVFRIIQAL